MSAPTAALFAAAEQLSSARRVFVVTGAGLSAESGLPTYRGVGGLYEESCPDEGLEIEDILSGSMLKARPELTWKYLRHIEEAVRGAKPSDAHRVLAAMQSRFDQVLVLTQNVDGLHHAAGSRDVIDIHGNIHELVCTGCGDRRRVTDFGGLSPLPRCERCGAVVRPDVVLFGEGLPREKVERLESELARGFDVYLSIGTSSAFAYVAAPILAAARRGKPTIEINPGLTILSDEVELKLSMRAGEALSAIWQRLVPGGRA